MAALETERGCGFRKAGGMYLVGPAVFASCDRLPSPIAPCGECGFEPRQVRGHAWVSGRLLGDHKVPTGWNGARMRCRERVPKSSPLAGHGCPVCNAGSQLRLLMWVGAANYTPHEFVSEASGLGISKRISEIPVGLVLGETWVLLAHPDACFEPVSWTFRWLFGDGEVGTSPGIISAFVPQRIELILRKSQATPERAAAEALRGVDVVIIPDGASDARLSWRPGEADPTLDGFATPAGVPA